MSTDNNEKEVDRRWAALIKYRHKNGDFTRVYSLVEFSELATFIEDGPHWDTIISIEVNRINPIYPGITVEESLKL